MPLGTLDRLPIPSLTTYSILSAALFASLVYNAKQVTNNPTLQSMELGNDKNGSSYIFDDDEYIIDLENINVPDSVKNVIFYMIEDGFPRCVFINAITCAMVLFGKILQRIVFGNLRSVEVINFREKLSNYSFYKCIFLFGIIKVQRPVDVILLLGWFGILGFLQIFVQFSKDRLEYMTTASSQVTFWNRYKIISLLLCLFMVANYMIYLCLNYVVNLGYNIFAFMIAECLSITLRVPHILIKYVIDPFEAKFIRDQNQRFLNQNSIANFILNKMEMSFTYFMSLGLELADLCLELLHYLHMLLWGNIFFSVASFAICMHVRHLMTEIQRKIKKHRNYMWILNHMEKEYPIATESELAENSDNCAICWESMEIARKLPCKHLFHSTCLQLWLEQDTSCPTCRYVLNMNGSNISQPSEVRQNRRIFRMGHRLRMPGNRRHFFHFDGSRYVSWFPLVSVQVMSSSSEILDSELQVMAAQVQQVFPHYPTEIIIENLRQTRSVNDTSNNILEGLLPIPDDHLNFVEESPPNIFAEPSTSSASGHPIASSYGSPINSDNSVPTDESNSSNHLHCPDFNIIEKEFSPTPAERELALRNRKEQLIRKAKQKFLEKNVES